MLNLLRASYRRMFKSKLLYLFMILMFLIVLFYWQTIKKRLYYKINLFGVMYV